MVAQEKVVGYQRELDSLVRPLAESRKKLEILCSQAFDYQVPFDGVAFRREKVNASPLPEDVSRFSFSPTDDEMGKMAGKFRNLLEDLDLGEVSSVEVQLMGYNESAVPEGGGESTLGIIISSQKGFVALGGGYSDRYSGPYLVRINPGLIGMKDPRWPAAEFYRRIGGDYAPTVAIEIIKSAADWIFEIVGKRIDLK